MNQKDFARRLQENPQLLQGIMQSRDGQVLMQLLQMDGGSALKHATQQAQNGSMAEMAQMLKGIMASPDGKALLERLSREFQK